MTTATKAPARFLVDDDVEEFGSKKGYGIETRIRVWRGKDALPVVLASQVDDKNEWRLRRRFTARVANYVNSAVLGHPATGMLYFEDDIGPSGERELNQCYFEYHGNAHRLTMFMPVRKLYTWKALELLVGAKVER